MKPYFNYHWFIELSKEIHTDFVLLVHGNWGRWVDGVCSVTCGNGLRPRTRQCNNPAPANGGNTCVGSNTGQTACALGSCPGIVEPVIFFCIYLNYCVHNENSVFKEKIFNQYIGLI